MLLPQLHSRGAGPSSCALRGRQPCVPASGWQALVPFVVTDPTPPCLSGVSAPEADSPGPPTGVYAPRCIRGFVSSTQGSSSICRDRKEVGAPYRCNPTFGVCVRLVPLGRRDRGCRQLPFTGSLSSYVPGPQPPCLHPCLLMGPIWPRQERLQVPLIALSPGRTISDTQRMF